MCSMFSSNKTVLWVETEAGLGDYQMLYQRFPDSPWLHMLYGGAYMSNNDYANAEIEYE